MRPLLSNRNPAESGRFVRDRGALAPVVRLARIRVARGLARLERRTPSVTTATWRVIALLAAASFLTCLLWALRIIVAGRPLHVFLPWNLFLAWLPLVLAIAALELGRIHQWRSWRPWLAAGGWLLFFPNAPYILTDLVHLRSAGSHRFWVDLIIILLFAWPGFLVGCLSLRLMHDRLTRHRGWLAGWCFVVASCGLAGVGVYIGRFLRWNSWDILTHPSGLAFDLLGIFGHPSGHPAYRFSALFALLMFVGYVTLQAHAFLNPGRPSGQPPPTIPW